MSGAKTIHLAGERGGRCHAGYRFLHGLVVWPDDDSNIGTDESAVRST